MTDAIIPPQAQPRSVFVPPARLEIFSSGEPSELTVCAAHPVDFFGEDAAQLLAAQSRTRVICVNPRTASEPIPPLATQVERIEAVRRELGIRSWIFWGMSGGGFLAQLYARQFPESLRGIVIESACGCFAERLRDPQCALSPNFPAWRQALAEHGLAGAPPELASYEDTEWLDVQGLGQILRLRGGPAVLVAPMPLSSAMKEAMPELLRFDARPWLSTLRTPVLVICGAADPIVPVHCARAVADAIAASTFVEVPSAGHVPTAEKREEVGRAFADFAARLAGLAGLDRDT